MITIPPPCWINAAHKHGVPVLGKWYWKVYNWTTFESLPTLDEKKKVSLIIQIYSEPTVKDAGTHSKWFMAGEIDYAKLTQVVKQSHCYGWK